MGIDVATWQARIGLSYSRQSRYACCPLSVQYVEGGKMGSGGGHEQHTSSAPGLHGGRLPVTDAGIHAPQSFHWEVWVWQGLSSHVESGRLCPECESQRDGGYAEHYWVCLLLGVCAVVLVLLMMAGDVERNPGPTGKEGS